MIKTLSIAVFGAGATMAVPIVRIRMALPRLTMGCLSGFLE